MALIHTIGKWPRADCRRHLGRFVSHRGSNEGVGEETLLGEIQDWLRVSSSGSVGSFGFHTVPSMGAPSPSEVPAEFRITSSRLRRVLVTRV